VIGTPAHIPADQTEADTQNDREDHTQETNDKRHLGAEHDGGEHITALVIGPEKVLAGATFNPGWRLERIHQIERRDVVGIERSQNGCCKRGDKKDNCRQECNNGYR